jgi:hypothetical protein
VGEAISPFVGFEVEEGVGVGEGKSAGCGVGGYVGALVGDL